MIQEKVEDYFKRSPELRILFFFDEAREYEEEVKGLDLQDIHIEVWENNPFTLKCKLIDELSSSNVLLYLPIKQPTTKDDFQKFPLMGLLLANKELQLDNVGAFMEKYQLQRHQKSLVSKYKNELKYTGVQEVCKPILKASNFEEPVLQRALLSSFLNFKTIEPWTILVGKLLTLSIEDDAKNLQRVVKKLKDLSFEDVVLRHIQEVTGTAIQKIDRDNLLHLARAVLYNKLTQTMGVSKTNDPYAALKIDDATQITRLNQMLQEVERQPQLKLAFDGLLEKVSKDIKGSKLIEVYGEDANFAEFNAEMIWTIVEKLQPHIISAPTEIIKKFETLSLQSNLPLVVQQVLKYGIQVAKVHQHINEIATYILDTPEEYVHWYTEILYKVDSSFRRAILIKKSIDDTEIPNHFEFDAIQAGLNATYDKHTDTLNREWLKCLNHFNFDYSKINVPKQYDFYKTEIADKDQKVVIIISDALRYEAGYELLSQMHGDPKNIAEIRYMLASIPSKTNVGMAQLLPGSTFEFNGGDVKIDSVSASSTYRSKILESTNPSSLAIQYGALDGLERPEIRKIFKNDVVYVYHDVIDDTGDKRASERRTFDAVKDSIEELKKFVKLLHGSYNVAKVYITADHGFLYNDKKIEEKDQERLPSIDVALSHNRYYATTQPAKPDLGYCIPISATTKFKDDIYITVPFSVNRYKKSGVGHQFVHGGGSLQELIVPLIESSRKREKVTKKVNPILIHKGTLKVVSNILKINVLQENEVSRHEKERIITIGLYKEATLVSNQEEKILNSTSESPSERLLSVELILNGEAASESFLKLKIFDKEDMLNPIVEERVENKSIISNDFG
jgi:uncharacterized protein (TIGR02687 family)